MCTITINIDETQALNANPTLTDLNAITRWAQHVVDVKIADLLKMRYEQRNPYTIEELHARTTLSQRDLAAGLGQESEAMFRELENEFAREEATLMSEAV